MTASRQARVESGHGLMTILSFELPGTRRPIGLTLSADWLPTRAQGEFAAGRVRAMRPRVA